MNKSAFLFLLLFTINLTAQAGIFKTSFSNIAAEQDATSIRIDDYLPNPGVNAAIIGDIPVDVFTNAGIGLIADGEYGDGTSFMLTSDFYIRGNTYTHSWTFVDPDNTAIKAGVQQLGFYVGSMADTVTASFYDASDNLLGTQVINANPIGFASDDEAIHRVVFSQSGGDHWVIGSFTHSNTIDDIVFSGFQTVAEPSSYFLLGLGILTLLIRRHILKQ